ncbi:CBN-CLEC-113 protein [Caenorhabditis brenneri]|uniref:CBN-CLEC-113 protein n=1 Tax=Caenorhabditis brenneri TaxID=135651 RepID=G0MJ93_CAEBE|nr:CBN-CLEC-113 protein [Caenorhabditis brenneri]
MLVTNGEPTDFPAFSYPLASNPSATWDDCLEVCFNVGECIVVFNNTDGCQMFTIGQIRTATRNKTGPVIAFKVLVDNSTNTCPANDMETGRGYYQTGNTYQPYNVTFDDPIWTFMSPPAQSCPVVEHYACCNRTVASIMCYKEYNNSMLSGLDNQAEYDWAAAQGMKVWTNVSSGLVGSKQYTNTGIWLDGNRTSACTGITASPCNSISAFQFSDPLLSTPSQGYYWLPGQPDGSVAPADGLVLKYNSETDYGIDDTRLVNLYN